MSLGFLVLFLPLIASAVTLLLSRRRGALSSYISTASAFICLLITVSLVQNGDNKELIWILEHPKTYTAGVSFMQNEVINKKIKVIKTNRGGKITLHNPGQKIIYFVINLNNRKKDIRKFINTIELTIIEFLKIFKIDSKKDKNNIIFFSQSLYYISWILFLQFCQTASFMWS